MAQALFENPLTQLNDGPCKPGQVYKQEDLQEPTKVAPTNGRINTQLVVAFRKRCVPVWIPDPNDSTKGAWQMQTLKLRTYGFPRNPNVPITEAEAAAAQKDPEASFPNIAWSSPGPTFVMTPASKPGAPDGTVFQMRLYNSMPVDANDQKCAENIKCDTTGPNAGVDPATGKCRVPPTTANNGWPGQTPSQTVNGQVIEPPNCFHGLNSTNFHFHGFHVSPQQPQDNVGIEILPAGTPPPTTQTHMHGPDSLQIVGHYDYLLDPLRYTQAPGTHWYHAHKHGSTALHVLNGQVGTFEIRGEFDQKLNDYFEKKGGGKLKDRLLVVQQLQEKQPGLGGVDQTGAVLINGQANPFLHMKRGEIQRWRFVGATMQASAALNIGFGDVKGQTSPEVRQIAMDGVQFSPENYTCQPFLNNADCSKQKNTTSFDELTDFSLSPGNRVDVLVKAPDKKGTHCMLLDVTTGLAKAASKIRKAQAAEAKLVAGACKLDTKNTFGVLFTLIVDDEKQEMTFPSAADFPPMALYLANLPKVSDPKHQKDVHYEMVGQGDLPGTQFWINQAKYNGACANETLTLDVPEQWTLWNNSLGIAHPFHIHQNPFQLISQSDRGTYKYPVWRDVMPIPVSPTQTDDGKNPPTAREPNSNPSDPKHPWGSAVIVYEAKEFTGGFVNHCHILGHEDRGMMHATQAVCANGQFASTGPVPPGAKCDGEGFCPSDCVAGKPKSSTPACATPPAQTSDWPKAFGYPPPATSSAKP